MKRFRFRLESVLSLRAVAETAERERFGVAQRALDAALAERRAAAARRDALAAALAEAASGTFRPAEHAQGLLALDLARRAELDAARLAEQASAARDRARETWLAARRRLQVIERLETRARQAHRDDTDKAEQTLLDELASLSAARASAPFA